MNEQDAAQVVRRAVARRLHPDTEPVRSGVPHRRDDVLVPSGDGHRGRPLLHGDVPTQARLVVAGLGGGQDGSRVLSAQRLQVNERVGGAWGGHGGPSSPRADKAERDESGRLRNWRSGASG